jgi:hypothetical protein
MTIELDRDALAAAIKAIFADCNKEEIPKCAYYAPTFAESAICAYLAYLSSTKSEKVAVKAEPVAWLKPRDIARLAEMHSGAMTAQISNLSFIGCTVPVYALASEPANG